MSSGSPDERKAFGWRTRLKYGWLAAAAAWFAGWIITFPFELSLAWRYVDGNARQLPESLVKGMVVWGGFSFFMAMAGFAPMVLPAVLLISPRWFVRWRRILIPGAPLAAGLAIYQRMGLLHAYHFHHPKALKAFFFTAPNFFVITFALVVVWVYVMLARRRLRADAVEV
jgi:hypothetical protein